MGKFKKMYKKLKKFRNGDIELYEYIAHIKKRSTVIDLRDELSRSNTEKFLAESINLMIGYFTEESVELLEYIRKLSRDLEDEDILEDDWAMTMMSKEVNERKLRELHRKLEAYREDVEDLMEELRLGRIPPCMT